jgi:hypothetical protein
MSTTNIDMWYIYISLSPRFKKIAMELELVQHKEKKGKTKSGKWWA